MIRDKHIYELLCDMCGGLGGGHTVTGKHASEEEVIRHALRLGFKKLLRDKATLAICPCCNEKIKVICSVVLEAYDGKPATLLLTWLDNSDGSFLETEEAEA